VEAAIGAEYGGSARRVTYHRFERRKGGARLLAGFGNIREGRRATNLRGVVESHL